MDLEEFFIPQAGSSSLALWERKPWKLCFLYKSLPSTPPRFHYDDDEEDEEDEEDGANDNDDDGEDDVGAAADDDDSDEYVVNRGTMQGTAQRVTRQN